MAIEIRLRRLFFSRCKRVSADVLGRFGAVAADAVRGRLSGTAAARARLGFARLLLIF